ncbi:MAG: arsenic resistance N-acetyltransferase ArsN2 [Gemmatimonadota bacterium]
MNSPAPLHELRFRLADAADRPAVESLLSSESLPIVGVANALSRFWLVDRDGKLLGMAGLEAYGTAALLRSVLVIPEWRGLGLAGQLVGRVLDDARAVGVQEVYLLTTTAEGYFRALGFVPVARNLVAAEVQSSVEFREACPASAACLVLQLTSGRSE